MKRSRRQFIETASKVLLGASLIGALPLSSIASSSMAKAVHIEAIPGRHYPASFLRFIKKAKFSTPAEAVASVKDRRLAYNLVWK